MNVKLVLFKKNGTQKTLELPSTSSVIGRRHDCDLQITLSQVSKRHCQLSIDNGSLKVRDLGSRNGTFINGERVEETDAKPGDYLRVGPLTFLLQIDGQPSQIVPPPDDLFDDVEAPAAKKEAAAKASVSEDDDFIDFDDFAGDDIKDEPGGGLDDDDLEAEFGDLDDEIGDSLEDL